MKKFWGYHIPINKKKIALYLLGYHVQNIPIKGLHVQGPATLCKPATFSAIGHFTVVYLVAKPLIWSEAEGDLVVIETSI